MNNAYIKIDRPVAGFYRLSDMENPDSEVMAEIEARQEEREHQTLKSQIEQLEDELQKTREESYALGFQEGLEAERVKHKQEIESYAKQFSELAATLGTEFDEAMSNIEEPLLGMSFDIAEKILRVDIPEKLKKDGLLKTLQSFLSEVLHSDSVVIKLSPSNFEWVQSKTVLDGLEKSFPGTMKFVADVDLDEGECLVETPEHVIDGSYRHQLENLERNLV